jgi:hypothetical protein
MSNQKVVYYNLDEIDSKGATINLIYGERANGKSYQVKHKKGVNLYLETALEESIKDRKRFMLVRRWKEDIRTDKIEQYFLDVDIYKLTEGKYNCITVFKGKIWLSNYNPEAKPQLKRGDYIGYVVALSTEQTYAGASYLDVYNIIFEEFMSRNTPYLPHEPDRLMSLYSTVDRKRGTTRIWLVGNTISRICPYFKEWGLKEVFDRLKQGEIDVINVPTGAYNDDGTEEFVKVAIEHCKSTGKSSHVIGNNAKMSNEGEWASDPQPLLPLPYSEYDVMFRMMFYFQGYKFIAEYLFDNVKDYCWFIKPYKGAIKDDILVISDIVKLDRHWQRNVYNVDLPNPTLHRLLNTFRENNIFYSDDLTGTEFKQAIDFQILR